jgi:GNAT superfamily N-acetyltransferase
MPPFDVAIRDARHSGADQIAPLLGAVGEPATWIYVAEADGRLVGLTGLRALTLVERDEPIGRLIALVVEQDVRSMGVGRALVEHVEERAPGGLRRARPQLERSPRGHPRLYRRLGFADVSRRFVEDLTRRAPALRRARR